MNTTEINLHQRAIAASVRFLRRRSWEVLEIEWASPDGSSKADIIARDEEDLVFIKVIERESSEKGFPEENLDRAAEEHLAAQYLEANPGFVDVPVRFDVMALLILSENHAFLRLHTRVL